MSAFRAYVATAAVLCRAGRRALPDALDAWSRRGFVRGLQVWQRLVVADLSTLIAVDAAMMEALLTGAVKEEVRRD